MAGENGVFGAGSPDNTAVFRVSNIAYGISGVYTTTESRYDRTAYFNAVVQDNFIVTLQFVSWQEYVNAASFFFAYMTAQTNAYSTGDVQPMGVIVPDRNFFGVGMPQSGITFGDQVGELVYAMDIPFIGTTNNVGITDKTQNETVPASQDWDGNDGSHNFYPWGTQSTAALSPPNAGTSADAALFDTTFQQAGAAVSAATSSLSLNNIIGKLHL